MGSFSSKDLESLIRHHRGDPDGDISFRRIVTGKFNTSYFVNAGNEQLVLRIAPARNEVFVFYERDMMRQEPDIHHLVLSQTAVPVPHILTYDDSHTLIDRDFLIMERLPGLPLTEAHSVSNDLVLKQVGEYLAQVHSLTAEYYGYLGAHQPMEPQPTWLDAFEIMWNKMIDDVVMVGHYDAEESEMMRSLLDQYIAMFDHPVPASLLHMDIWHQNILVNREGNVTGLVDWDRALWGDPEIEFAVLDYCGISEPAFWEGYGQKRDLSDPARIRQVFYLLYEVQKYIVIRHGRGRDPVAAKRYKRQVMEIAQKYL
ncbi:phosphotransferase family protein [Candidatus Poribacteria bacterium]